MRRSDLPANATPRCICRTASSFFAGKSDGRLLAPIHLFQSADTGINTVPHSPVAPPPPLKMNCGPMPRAIACVPVATASQGDMQPG